MSVRRFKKQNLFIVLIVLTSRNTLACMISPSTLYVEHYSLFPGLGKGPGNHGEAFLFHFGSH